jgi:hypothetical protein
VLFWLLHATSTWLFMMHYSPRLLSLHWLPLVTIVIPRPNPHTNPMWPWRKPTRVNKLDWIPYQHGGYNQALDSSRDERAGFQTKLFISIRQLQLEIVVLAQARIQGAGLAPLPLICKKSLKLTVHFIVKHPAPSFPRSWIHPCGYSNILRHYVASITVVTGKTLISNETHPEHADIKQSWFLYYYIIIIELPVHVGWWQRFCVKCSDVSEARLPWSGGALRNCLKMPCAWVIGLVQLPSGKNITPTKQYIAWPHILTFVWLPD